MAKPFKWTYAGKPLRLEVYMNFSAGVLVHLPRNSYTLLVVAQTNTLR
jgi:hypothetical protein